MVVHDFYFLCGFSECAHCVLPVLLACSVFIGNACWCWVVSEGDNIGIRTVVVLGMTVNIESRGGSRKAG